MTNSIPKQKRRSRWLDWKPKGIISQDMPKTEPTKPTEPSFVGFVGSPQGVSQNSMSPISSAELVQRQATRGELSPSAQSGEIDHAHPRSSSGTKKPCNSILTPIAESELPEWRRRFIARVQEIKQMDRKVLEI